MTGRKGRTKQDASMDPAKGGGAERARLETLRARIDEIDARIVEALDRRADLAVKTATLKHRMGLPLYQPGREAVVLARVAKKRKRFPENSLTAIYREIIGASLSLERPFTVAILGPEATYTHIAAIKHFGREAEIMAETTIPDVFTRVEKGEADVGVVPIENSTEGMIVHTLDGLVDSNLSIAAEILVPVHHHLMIHPSTPHRGDSVRIKRIVSHPQSLGQCRNYLEAHYPGIPVRTAPSNAAAAIEAARTPGVAAIASKLAAERYGLRVLHAGIEDQAGNTTRFLLLKRAHDANPDAVITSTTTPTGADKTSIAFSMKDRAGALFKMLEPFKRHRVNLTKIESRPSRVQKWRYVFFLDMEGHVSEPRIRRAIGELEKECEYYRCLGSYPQGR